MNLQHIKDQLTSLRWYDSILIPLKLLIGWWYPFLLPFHFRGYARNVVYNYVLARNKRKWLGRLWQRRPFFRMSSDGSYRWILNSTEHPGNTGYVKYRSVGAIHFALVVLILWMWLDDDANEDTTDIGYCNSISVGPRGYRAGNADRSRGILPTALVFIPLIVWVASWFTPSIHIGWPQGVGLLIIAVALAFMPIRQWVPQYRQFQVKEGKAFDIGDKRAIHPYFNLVAAFVWLSRNPVMNIQYLLAPDYQ